MFPNFTGWSYIKAVLFALVTLDGVFLTANAFSAQVTHYAEIASLFLGAAGTIVSTLSGSQAGSPAVTKLFERKSASSPSGRAPIPPLSLLCLALAVSFAALACQGCTKAQGTAVETAGVDAGVCVLTHFSDPPEQIAIECGLASVQDVIKILDAGRAMHARLNADAGSVRP